MERTEILALRLKKQYKLSQYEALNIAALIRGNELFEKANVLDRGQVPALEEMAMQIKELNENIEQTNQLLIMKKKK